MGSALYYGALPTLSTRWAFAIGSMSSYGDLYLEIDRHDTDQTMVDTEISCFSLTK
jgi:hypothetical protein